MSLAAVSAMVFKLPSNWVTLQLRVVRGPLFFTAGSCRSSKRSSTSASLAGGLCALVGTSLSPCSQCKYHPLKKYPRVITRRWARRPDAHIGRNIRPDAMWVIRTHFSFVNVHGRNYILVSVEVQFASSQILILYRLPALGIN